MTKTIHLEIDDPNTSAFGLMTCEITGTAPLLQHRFGTKARTMMLNAQTGKARGKKAPKVPEADALDALYVIGQRPKEWADLEKGKTRFGVLAPAFKAALVSAAKMCDMFKTDARSAFFVEADAPDVDGGMGGLIELHSSGPPLIHESPVRIAGTADIRHRPIFHDWRCTLRLRWNVRTLSAEQLLGIVRIAGVGVGVCEFRPLGKNSSGDFGTWRVTACSAEVPDLDVEIEAPAPKVKKTRATAAKRAEV